MESLQKISQFFQKTFALWVLVAAITAFFFPEGFKWIAPYITWLLGIIMFGMGITLSTDDFKEVAKRPVAVLLGVIARL